VNAADPQRICGAHSALLGGSGCHWQLLIGVQELYGHNLLIFSVDDDFVPNFFPQDRFTLRTSVADQRKLRRQAGSVTGRHALAVSNELERVQFPFVVAVVGKPPHRDDTAELDAQGVGRRRSNIAAGHTEDVLDLTLSGDTGDEQVIEVTTLIIISMASSGMLTIFTPLAFEFDTFGADGRQFIEQTGPAFFGVIQRILHSCSPQNKINN